MAITHIIENGKDAVHQLATLTNYEESEEDEKKEKRKMSAVDSIKVKHACQSRGLHLLHK